MIQIKTIVKQQFQNEEIKDDCRLRIFIMEKGFGLVKCNEQSLDFLVGRVYFIPIGAKFQLSGYIASGYLITIDPSLYQHFLLQEYKRSVMGLFLDDAAMIDLSWQNMAIAVKGIVQLEKTYTKDIALESLKFLFSLLFVDVDLYEVLLAEKVAIEKEVLLKFNALIARNYKTQQTIDFYLKILAMDLRDLNLICKKLTGKFAITLVNEKIASAVQLEPVNKKELSMQGYAFNFAISNYIRNDYYNLNSKPPFNYKIPSSF